MLIAGGRLLVENTLAAWKRWEHLMGAKIPWTA
jgi:hypothetical protein